MNEPDRQERAEWIAAALREHEADLVRYATRLVRDPERALDVVQETFLRLWTAERAKVDGHLRPWLFTVCRNLATDTRRKESRMSKLTDGHAATTPAPNTPASTSTVEQSEQRGAAMRLVDALPPRQAEAVRLKFQSGLSYREISEVMQTTVNNVGVLIHTGLKTIREQMSQLESPRTSPHTRAIAEEG